MKAFTRFLMVALLSVAWIGCDSSDPTDAEKMVGSWTLVKITDGTGDITAVWTAGVQTFRATLNADNTSNLVVDYTAAAEAGRPR